MNRILVPVDFSKDSINALEHALFLVNKIGAHLRMLHVKKTEDFQVPYHFDELEDTFIHTVQEYFEKLLERHNSQYLVNEGIFDFKIRKGSVYREIVNQAKYGDAFMIVMGTHGTSGFEEFLIGSNAFRVVSHAPCPVLTFRNDFKRKRLSRIVIPIDVTPKTRKKIPIVADIASCCGAQVHVLGVHESSDDVIVRRVENYMDQAVSYLEQAGVKVIKSMRKGDNITNSTIEYAREVDADLIAIMTNQTQSSKHLFMGSYAQQMVNSSSLPVLSVPNN